MRAAGLLVLAGCLSTPARPLAGDARGSADAQVDTPAFTTRHWVHSQYTPGPAVNFSSLTYDSDRHEVLRYGGETQSGTTNDAAMHRLTPTGWQLVCDPCLPGARSSASFAYDPVRHVAVLVGGSPITGVISDAFFYEWNGSAWTQTTTQLPSARYAVDMVFDPSRGKLIVIGGIDSTGPTNDAYTYDGTLTSLPNLGSYVEGNGAGTATYDVTSSRILVAPGRGLGTQTGGDEVLGLTASATSWSTVCTSCGAWRRLPALVFDPVLHHALLIGGFDMVDANPDGTWALESNQWMKVDPNPPGRAGAALTYDASRDTVVLYGGYGPTCGGNGDCDETWEMVPN